VKVKRRRLIAICVSIFFFFFYVREMDWFSRGDVVPGKVQIFTIQSKDEKAISGVGPFLRSVPRFLLLLPTREMADH
jgi:hypothetical protein